MKPLIHSPNTAAAAVHGRGNHGAKALHTGPDGDFRQALEEAGRQAQDTLDHAGRPAQAAEVSARETITKAPDAMAPAADAAAGSAPPVDVSALLAQLARPAAEPVPLAPGATPEPGGTAASSRAALAGQRTSDPGAMPVAAQELGPRTPVHRGLDDSARSPAGTSATQRGLQVLPAADAATATPASGADADHSNAASVAARDGSQTLPAFASAVPKPQRSTAADRGHAATATATAQDSSQPLHTAASATPTPQHAMAADRGHAATAPTRDGSPPLPAAASTSATPQHAMAASRSHAATAPARDGSTPLPAAGSTAATPQRATVASRGHAITAAAQDGRQPLPAAANAAPAPQRTTAADRSHAATATARTRHQPLAAAAGTAAVPGRAPLDKTRETGAAASAQRRAAPEPTRGTVPAGTPHGASGTQAAQAGPSAQVALRDGADATSTPFPASAGIGQPTGADAAVPTVPAERGAQAPQTRTDGDAARGRLAGPGRDALERDLRMATRTAEMPARASRADAAEALAGKAAPAFEMPLAGPGLQAGTPASAMPPPALAGVASAPAAATQPAVSAGPALPYQAHITAAMGTPAFAPALGAQVRTLVQDGIGHARLELNPVEMGPVSVHIALEGQQAHVEFGADLAATRAALQESLPTLAAALQESGITLTGGVSERQAGSGGHFAQERGAQAPQTRTDGDAARGRLAGPGRDALERGLRTATRTAEMPARASRADAAEALAGKAAPAFEMPLAGPGLQAGTPASAMPPPALAGVASAPAAATQPAVSAGPALPYQAHITAAMGTPAFAPALGAQVRMLVQDGIGHARLELNPVEMGPVSVHIALEGQQAHVEFGADLAATRAALQESLPTLAAALQESGITLTGGGVSERQAGSGGHFGQDSGTPGGRAQAFAPAEGAAAGTAMAPAAAPAVPGGHGRGTVDLYA